MAKPRAASQWARAMAAYLCVCGTYPRQLAPLARTPSQLPPSQLQHGKLQAPSRRDEARGGAGD